MFFVNAASHLIKACNRSFFSLSLILFRSVDEVVPFNVERMKYCRNHWKNKWKNTGVLTKVYLLTYNEWNRTIGKTSVKTLKKPLKKTLRNLLKKNTEKTIEKNKRERFFINWGNYNLFVRFLEYYSQLLNSKHSSSLHILVYFFFVLSEV